jgi:hypothetical protein
MNKKILFIILVQLTCIEEVKPQGEEHYSLVYTCDTADYPFLRINDSTAQKIFRISDVVIHVYEGTNFYYPAYSFIFWKKEKTSGNMFIRDLLPNKSTFKTIKDSSLGNIECDSVIRILNILAKVGSDTSEYISHNHLLYFHFFKKNLNISFKICESQFISFPYQDQIKYLKDIIALLRKENR